MTGVVAPVHDIARVLHRHGALALFDYAAAGPYVDIDMSASGDPEARLDAVFLSPHKYLGGPGSCGLLVFDESLYPVELSPSVGGGGTVTYVNPTSHDFTDDIEARETAGTPGFFQTLRAAYALEVKNRVGVPTIHAREHEYASEALRAWTANDRIDVLGPHDPDGRLGIVSFNIKQGPDRILHPRFVTVLLDDLFGIQSRAGCSCAGPYGHALLGIDEPTSLRYRTCTLNGMHGLKPGWARVGFHYTMDRAEVDYVIEAVQFIARHGARFLPLYTFDVASGVWKHRDGRAALPAFALPGPSGSPVPGGREVPRAERERRYAHALREAEAWAARLGEPDARGQLDADLADLQFFAIA